jgi:hypothetical protein
MPKSKSLSALAKRIREEHAAVIATSRKGIEHAFAAGAHLIEAQDLVPYGEWGRWLAENCATLSARTASRYMRLARARPVLEEHFRHSGETDPDALTLRAAEDFLGPDESEAPEPKPDPDDDDDEQPVIDSNEAPTQPDPQPDPNDDNEDEQPIIDARRRR